MKLGFLRPLYQQADGYVSVYLDTSQAEANAAQTVRLRWRATRDRLAGAGAGPATLDAIGEVVTDPGLAAPGRAVFGHGGAVTFTAALPAPPRREIARVAPLPHLLPLLAQEPPQPRHLRVSAARSGGDVVAVTSAGGSPARQAGRTEWPVHTSPAGSWPPARRSAGEAGDGHAKALAALVTEAAGEIAAERILLAGNARARELLVRHLSSPLRAAVITIDQEVPAGSAAMAEAACAALSREEDRQCRERFDDWRTRLAGEAGVEGLAATLTGLAEGRVSELFLAGQPGLAAAWIGPAVADLAASGDQLRERGVARPACERADAAIIRAVALTGAELRLLPQDLGTGGQPDDAGPQDGICAILRHPPAGGPPGPPG